MPKPTDVLAVIDKADKALADLLTPKRKGEDVRVTPVAGKNTEGSQAQKGEPDGTFRPNGVWFGGTLWPLELAPFLFNALKGTPEPLPERLWKKYKDSAAFGDRAYGPWVALLGLSTQYYEVELPAIEAELAAGAGVDVGGAGGPGGDPAPYETIGTILGLGGRAAREMAYQDPASFINLLVTEATGEGETSGLLRNFLISQAPRLYSLAGLDELLGRQGDVGGLERTQDIFEQFVTPGSDFAGSRANVVRDLGELAGMPSKQPGAAAADPRDFFDDAFFLAANTLAPTMTPTAAATLFNNDRRELERALFTTATVQGKFKGSPLEWLQSRGYF